jgi:galactose-1-phosphate uridylyltransferase
MNKLTEIIDITQIRKEKSINRIEEIKDLDLIIHCCEVTYRSLLHINRPYRVLFTNLIERYLNYFKRKRNNIKVPKWD